MGRMKNGAKYMKYVLIAFNLVVMIFSLLLIGLSVAFSSKCSTLIEKLPKGDQLIATTPSWVPWMMFFIGLIIFLICILGCYGAFNENYWALVMYAIILFGVIILKVILGVFVYSGIILFATIEPTPMEVDYLLIKTWPNLNKISPQSATAEDYSAFYVKLQTSDFKPVLEVQEKFKCCGVFGKSDYRVNGTSLLVLAKSCCPTEVEKCTPHEAYNDGCLYKIPDMKRWLQLKRITQGVTVGFVCLQAMLVASALYLAKAIRQI